LKHCAPATRARARGATEAVIAGHNVAILNRIWIDIPKEKPFAMLMAGTPRCGVRTARRSVPAHPLHPELLIEIAIVNFAMPADTNRVATHQSANRYRIEGMNEQLHVFLEFPAMPQITGKPPDWEVRERIQLIKYDSEMVFEFAFVISLQLGLGRRQKRTDWIVNQMQWQPRIDSVA